MDKRATNGKVINFDWDGVICANNQGNYADAPPYLHAIEQINKAYDMGYYIKICTARYGDRENGNISKIYQRGWVECVTWLTKYGVKYDELILGKPPANLYVDDKACRVESEKGLEDWTNNFWPALSKIQNRDKYNQVKELDAEAEKVKEFS